MAGWPYHPICFEIVWLPQGNKNKVHYTSIVQVVHLCVRCVCPFQNQESPMPACSELGSEWHGPLLLFLKCWTPSPRTLLVPLIGPLARIAQMNMMVHLHHLRKWTIYIVYFWRFNSLYCLFLRQESEWIDTQHTKSRCYVFEGKKQSGRVLCDIFLNQAIA